MAKAKGIHTINVVRDRPNMDELTHYLNGLGADVVTTDDKLKAALGRHHMCLSRSQYWRCYVRNIYVLSWLAFY